jgi:hypothetical protein
MTGMAHEWKCDADSLGRIVAEVTPADATAGVVELLHAAAETVAMGGDADHLAARSDSTRAPWCVPLLALAFLRHVGFSAGSGCCSPPKSWRSTG